MRDRFRDRFTGACARLAAGIEVIHHHDCVVDQQAKRHDDADHRSLVQRHADDVEEDEHHQHRQGQRHADEQRGLPAKGDEQNAQHHPGTQQHVGPQFAKPRGGVDVLVEDDAHLDAARHLFAELLNHLHGARRPQVDAAARFHLGSNHDAALAADQGQAAGRITRALADGRDIPDADDLPVRPLLDRQVADLRHGLKLTHHLDGQVIGGIAQEAGRDLGIRQPDRIGHFRRGEVEGGDRHRIKRDENFLDCLPVNVRLPRAGHVE